MKIPNTDITLEELLDQMPMNVQYVDKDGFLRYQNKAAAARPAKTERKVGVNIKDCHALPESLVTIGRIFEDFRRGRKEPHYYVSKRGRKSMKVPVFDAAGNFTGILSYSHPIGHPKPERTI